jgi:membrane protein
MSASPVQDRATPALSVEQVGQDDPLPFKLLPEAVRGAVAGMKRHDLGELAGGVAFRVFLSIFPALIAAVAILGLVVSPADIRAMAEDPPPFVPEAAVELLRPTLEELTAGAGAGAGALAVTGLLAGLWAASTAAVTVIKALNRINDVAVPRSFLRQRAVAATLTLALLTAMAAVMALLVFGPQLQRAILPAQLVDSPLRYLVGLGQVAGALAILSILFSFIYWLAPNRSPRGRWRWSTPGGLVATVGWLVLSGGFTLYVQTAGDYNATYGALAGVVVLLIWLQLSNMVMLFGATIDAELRRLVAEQRTLVDAAGMQVLPDVDEGLRQWVSPASSPRCPPSAASTASAGRRGALQGAVLAGLAAGIATVASLLRGRRAAG